MLPALLRASGPSSITLEGGTDNPMAPPFDFLAQAYLPLVRRMGPAASIALENALLYDEIRKIFDGFVRASVQALRMHPPARSSS